MIEYLIDTSGAHASINFKFDHLGIGRITGSFREFSGTFFYDPEDLSTARIRECIGDKDRTKEIPDAIAKGFTTYGMQTFDQSLMQLVKNELVTYEEALKHVSNPDDFALRFRGIASTSDGSWTGCPAFVVR